CSPDRLDGERRHRGRRGWTQAARGPQTSRLAERGRRSVALTYPAFKWDGCHRIQGLTVFRSRAITAITRDHPILDEPGWRVSDRPILSGYHRTTVTCGPCPAVHVPCPSACRCSFQRNLNVRCRNATILSNRLRSDVWQLNIKSGANTRGSR